MLKPNEESELRLRRLERKKKKKAYREKWKCQKDSTLTIGNNAKPLIGDRKK